MKSRRIRVLLVTLGAAAAFLINPLELGPLFVGHRPLGAHGMRHGSRFVIRGRASRRVAIRGHGDSRLCWEWRTAYYVPGTGSTFILCPTPDFHRPGIVPT